jgi:hypothetical protein
VLIDEMEHNGGSLRDDQISIHQGKNMSFWIDLEICAEFLGVVGSIDQGEGIVESKLFEQHVRRSAGIRREIVKLVHRDVPFAFFPIATK